MMAQIVISMITALAEPTAIWLRVKVYSYMKFEGSSVDAAGPAAGQRDDEVVGLDRHVREHDEGRQEDRPQHRDDDAAVELQRALRRRSAPPS